MSDKAELFVLTGIYQRSINPRRTHEKRKRASKLNGLAHKVLKEHFDILENTTADIHLLASHKMAN